MTSEEGKREIKLHPGWEKGKHIYIRGRENENQVTSGERNVKSHLHLGKGTGKCSYIRGGEREVKLHPGRGKGNYVTSA